MSKTILLTGATGFIGGAILREALRRGHRVVALVRDGGGIEKQERLHLARGSLESAPWDEIKELKPDVCVHSAWISTPGVYLESPLNRVLVEASQKFLREALGNGIERVVVLGTCIEYANTGQRMKEDETPLGLASLYARSKNELREWIGRELSGMNVAWARIFYPYGPGEHEKRLSSHIVDQLMRGNEVEIKTPASMKDFIYIDDVASAVVTILESEFCGAINVGTGEGVSILDFARTIGSLLGEENLIKAALSPAEDAYNYVVADAGRLRGLGWKPKVELREGLRRLVGEIA